MSVPSYSAPIALLLRLKGWRLRALVTAVTVLAAVLIVSMMSLLLQGRVSGDYLLTGLVTAAIVAPLSLALLNQLVDLLAKQHEELLAGRLAETERRLNQALVESEARLRTLIDAVPDAIQFKDGEGRWQVANQVCLRLLGAEQTPWRGATDAEIAAANPHFAAVLASCRASDEAAWQAGTLRRDEESIPDGEGGHLQLDVIKVPLFEPDGRRQALVVIGRDISELKRSASALVESHGLLRAIVDTAPIRVFWKDRHLCYLGCNPVFAHDAGKSGPREVIGRDDYQMGWAEQADSYRADDRSVMDSGIARLSYEEPQTTPDGRKIWLRTSKVPLRNEDGETIGVLGIYDDITEYKRIEAELEQHRQHLEELVARRTEELLETEARASLILASSGDGLYGVDRHGVITFMNPAAGAMLGYTPEQAVGKDGHALFHHSRADGSPYPVGECPCHGTLRSGEERRVDDEVYWTAAGRPLPVLYSVHPMVKHGEVSGAVISFVDMSEQRALALAREKAVLAAETLAHSRRVFLANMSHEIRTPLNGVLGFAQIGHRNHGDSEKARHAFEKILASGNLLLGVINDILDFSKIEAGKLNVERSPVRIADVVRQAADVVRDRAQARDLEFTIDLADDLPAACMGDALRIGQVLLNLLANAIKFTDAGRVELAVSRRGDRLVFRVADTGIGMSADQMARLFKPFEQADGSTSRRFGGTGLGLAISKRLAELMGGDIRVMSREGAGSTFDFDLPLLSVPD